MTTNRKLAAILAADMVGYSRLMEIDEAGTLAAFKRRRKEVFEPLISKHHGRIFKNTGDGVLVEFSSPVNAVQCALELQQRMAAENHDLPDEQRVVLRIGVNLGDVIAEGRDRYGDAVNIAARLEGIAEPGGVMVSGTIYDHARNKIEARFEDLGVQTLKNIAEPVRTYRVTRAARVMTVPKPITERASIAVLPFVNMSADPDQDYFADGLTEDIITALSRVSGLTVIARTSSFAYRNQKADAKRVAKELNVRYVMEGSVRRAGDRVRVTAQLIDGMTDHHVWAERYDHPVGDIFDIQDEIMRSVAASTETQIQLSERTVIESRAYGELKARDLVIRAWARIYDFTPEALAEAAELAEHAIRLEPMNPRAHIIRTRVQGNRLWFGLIAHNEENVGSLLQLAELGVRLAPRDEWAHFCMAYAYEMADRMKEAMAECLKAIDLNPNFSNGYAELGRTLAALGQSEDAIEACRTALRLNPRDPSNWERHSTLALAHFAKGDCKASLEEARTATHERTDLPEGFLILAAAAAASGETEEAHRAVSLCVAHWPGICLANVMPIYIPRFVQAEHRQRLLTMLRKAGLPE